MKASYKGIFTEERALFQAQNISVAESVFDVGESPLKHSRDTEVSGTVFKGKYPLWYSSGTFVHDSTFAEGARAALWYTNDIRICDTLYAAPKGIRKCRNVTLTNVNFTDAPETLWSCRDVRISGVTVKGDYLAKDCENMVIEGLTLDGKYSFDGCRNVTISNSTIIGRDAFWNCENITVKNCRISGEYLGWNTKNLTLIDCTIESLQGMCYIGNLVLKRCKLINTTLAFEYSTVDADICGSIDSVINPLGGIIRADSIGELTLDEQQVDVRRTQIILRDKCAV